MLDRGSVLITGGTGFLGRQLVWHLLQHYPTLRRIVVFSRDELKQHNLRLALPRDKYPQLEFVPGDIRDAQRLRRSLQGIDFVVHAAALKHVSMAEEHPFEYVQTNILGSQNLIEAALDAGVQRVVAISSDKAAAPGNLYGATKYCADKLFVAANNLLGEHRTRFAVVRFGNFLGSSGSVVPAFLRQQPTGILQLTHPDMTRFAIGNAESMRLVMYALEHAWGGETYVPRLPSFRLTDLAEAIAPEARIEFSGIRPGEKLHEDMVTEHEGRQTLAYRDHFVIVPNILGYSFADYAEATGGNLVSKGFVYRSNHNEQWLSVAELRQQVAAFQSAPLNHIV